MATEPQTPGTAPQPAESPPDACPLSSAAQTRNLLVFAGCKGLIYLSAPVLYVGSTQAALCKRLGASDLVSNLPGVMYMALTVSPVLVAWYCPYISWLRRNLVACFAATAAVLAAMTLVLLSGAPASVVVPAVIVQAIVCGITLPVSDALVWEVLGRGASEKRRGLALSLAFGGGPVLAFFGSAVAQVLLDDDGKLWGMQFPRFEYPWNFAALFGAGVPSMVVAAYLASRAVVPQPERELSRQSFASAVLGGLGSFLSDPVLRSATLVIVLLYTGNTIVSNMGLFAGVLFNELPENTAGYQQMYRFGFKAVAGLVLGWLVARTSPRLGLLVTGAMFVATMAWSMRATSDWYLLAFGLFGAGELVGVYAPNYILSASRRADIRRNQAFVVMMLFPAAPAGMLFGAISDHYHQTALGYRASFAVCAALVISGIVAALFLLPARPRPEDAA